LTKRVSFDIVFALLNKQFRKYYVYFLC